MSLARYSAIDKSSCGIDSYPLSAPMSRIKMRLLYRKWEEGGTLSGSCTRLPRGRYTLGANPKKGLSTASDRPKEEQARFYAKSPFGRCLQAMVYRTCSSPDQAGDCICKVGDGICQCKVDMSLSQAAAALPSIRYVAKFYVKQAARLRVGGIKSEFSTSVHIWKRL